jgi:hypothetical protein
MVLPEMMVTLFALLTIYAHIKRAAWLYIISGSCLVITKESGLVLIVSILLYESFYFAFSSHKKPLDLLKVIGVTSLPLFAFCLFLLFQHSIHGWYFYPDHLAMQTFDIYQIMSKWMSITYWILIDQYRWILLIALLVASLLHFNNKWPISFQSGQLKYLTVYGLFAFCYLLFTSMNFYSARYLSVLIPFYSLVVAMGVTYLIKSVAIRWSVTGIAVCFLSYYSWVISRSKADDVSLGYLKYMNIQCAAVHFLEENQYDQQPIYTNFLMQAALRHPFAGYRKTDQVFTNLNEWDNRPKMHYQIFSSIEPDDYRLKIFQDSVQLLINRWECPSGWIEMYQITQY